jgi:hypothetical protein
MMTKVFQLLKWYSNDKNWNFKSESEDSSPHTYNLG